MTSAPAAREENGTRDSGSEAMLAYPHPGFKRCSRCRETLPLEAFGSIPNLACASGTEAANLPLSRRHPE
jgi:hypothetical protein